MKMKGKGSTGRKGSNLVAPPSKKTPRKKDSAIRVTSSLGTVTKGMKGKGKRIY